MVCSGQGSPARRVEPRYTESAWMSQAESDVAGQRPLDDWPRPLAFAFSGGGAFGSVHIGMVRALQERGITPDLVVGSSVGSLNGVMVAARPDEAADVLAGLWAKMSRRAVFGHGWTGVARNLVRHRTLSRLDGLVSLIDDNLLVHDFGDLAIPFAAVATDATNGEPELLSTGRIKPALLASSSIPGVFPPVEVAGRIYIDGGISANVPIRQAIAFGARSVIALDASPLTPARPPRSLSGGLFHTVSLMVRNQRAHAVDELASRYPILVMPSVTPHDIGTFNFNRTDELIEASYRAATAALDALAPSLRPRP